MDSPVALDALAMMDVLVAQEHLANQANLVALAMMDVLVAQEHLAEMEVISFFSLYKHFKLVFNLPNIKLLIIL
jgi:hypothetical protein